VQYNLARALARSGRSVRIVAGRDLGGPGMEGEVDFIAPLGALQFLWRLVGHVRRERPQVVVTTSNDVAVWMLLCRRWLFPDVAVVVSQHLSISAPIRHAEGGRWLKLELVRRAMRWAFGSADALIAVSQGVAEDMCRQLGLDRVRVTVIYNPVVGVGRRSPKPPLESAPWPFPDDGVPVVAFAGRLSTEKRPDLLLEAYLRVRRERPARLLFLGDGSMCTQLQAAISAAGVDADCAMPGVVDDVLPWLERCRLLVLPSDYEGFGNVLVEAMHAGIQVISTDCPSGPFEILAGGLFGQLVPVGAVGPMAEAMLASIDGRFHIDADALRQRAEAFSIARACAAYEEMFDSLPARRVPPVAES